MYQIISTVMKYLCNFDNGNNGYNSSNYVDYLIVIYVH